MKRRRSAWPWLWLAVFGVAGAAGYWYFNPQERPTWVTRQLPVAPSAEVALYRWKDDAGEWVVSDEKPPDGVAFERVSYRHDTNVMPSPEVDND